MQKFLRNSTDVNEYVSKGNHYPFPMHLNEICPKCNKKTKFSRHGFYSRYFLSSIYAGTIYVRRYICQCKGSTISLLPMFCLIRISIGFKELFKYIYDAYFRGVMTLTAILMSLNQSIDSINMSRQLLYFYRKRWLNNIKLLETGLRQINSKLDLPSKDLDNKKRAAGLLYIVKNQFCTLEHFTISFHKETNTSPFALLK